MKTDTLIANSTAELENVSSSAARFLQEKLYQHTNSRVATLGSYAYRKFFRLIKNLFRDKSNASGQLMESI